MARWLLVAGGFDVDAFAAPSGHNAQAALFCSIASPPGLFNFEETHQVWAFPPPAAAPEVLISALSWNCKKIYASVPVAVLKVSSAVDLWEELHVYVSGETAFGIFERPIHGEMVACKAPSFDMAVVQRR